MNRFLAVLFGVVVLALTVALVLVATEKKTRTITTPTAEEVPVRLTGGSNALTNNKKLLPHTASAQHMVSVALEYWTAWNHGKNPCPDGVDVSIRTLPANAIAIAPVGKGLCRMSYSPRIRRFGGQADVICAAFIHELGHSAMGLRHSDNPRNIMYWLLGSNIPNICHRPDVHKGSHLYQVVVPGLIRLQGALRRCCGMVLTSSTGGVHASGSYHYIGQAIDVAGSRYGMGHAVLYIKTHGYRRRLLEGIHRDTGARRAYTLSVAHGVYVSPSYWGSTTWFNHWHHLHLAEAR